MFDQIQNMEQSTLKSISNTFNERIHLLIGICESPIERIFLLKVIDEVIRDPIRFAFGLLTWETEVVTMGEKDFMPPSKYPLLKIDKWFADLRGLIIYDLVKGTRLELLPQYEVNGDRIFNEPSYRLDFAMFKYKDFLSQEAISKYCIECDGYSYHSQQDQIVKDNTRARDLLLRLDFKSIRFLGTEIHNLSGKEIIKILYQS